MNLNDGKTSGYEYKINDKNLIDLRWYPFKWQKEVLDDNHLYKILNIGRRAGKTVLGTHWLIDDNIKNGGVSLLISNTNKQLNDVHLPLFNTLLLPLLEKHICRIKESTGNLEIKFSKHVGSGRILLRSAEAAKGLLGLGEGLRRVWLDEFATAPNQKYIFNEILGPMGLTHNVEYLVTSTPYGFNYFYELCQKESTIDTYKTFHFNSFSNPQITQEKVNELIKSYDWSGREIKENIYGEFADVESDIFGDYTAIQEDYTYPNQSIYGHRYLVSVDLASVNDFTVIYILDTSIEPKKIVEKLRFRKEEYTKQEQIIIDICKKYNNAQVYIDYTNEKGVVHHLKNKVRVAPIVFTPKSKVEMIKNLAYHISKKTFMYSKYDTDLINEFSLYRGVRTDAGNIRYNAPEGLHDDCLSSLMMLLSGIKRLDTPTIITPQLPKEVYDPYTKLNKVKKLEDFYRGLYSDSDDDGGFTIPKA